MVARYDTPRGYNGLVRPADFDFAKFLGHELLVTFTAAAIAGERWSLLDDVLRIELFADFGSGPKALSFARLSAGVAVLDERTRRLHTRASAHADLLNERHTKGALADLAPMEAFVDADALLFLRSEVVQPALGPDEFWFPRSAPYIDHRVPAYLIKAEAVKYAAEFLKALGAHTLANVRAAYEKQSPHWSHFFRSMATPPLTVLRLDQIGRR